MRKKLKKLKKIVEDTSDEEDVKRSKKRKEVKKDTSDEEFKEFRSVKDRRKKRVVKDHGVNKEKEVGEVDLDKADEVSGKGSQKDVMSKTRVKGKIKSGGYFEEPTTDNKKDDDLKFKEMIVNDVKKDANPVEDSVTSRRLKEISCWLCRHVSLSWLQKGAMDVVSCPRP